MKKKVLSLILCLALVLGMVPVALAAAGAAPAEGLYSTYKDGVLSGPIASVPVPGPPDVELRGYEVTYRSGTEPAAYYYSPNGACTKDEMLPNNGISVEQVGETNVYKIFAQSSLSGSFCTSNGSQFPITFVEGPAKDEESLEATDRVSDLPDTVPAPTAFSYNSKTYYIGPSDGLSLDDQPLLWTTSNVSEAAEERMSFYVGIWEKTKDGYFPVDPETRDILVAGFNGTLTLEIYAAEEHQQTYPAEYAYETDWPCGRSWLFNAKMDGSWVVKVTGTFGEGEDAQTIESIGVVGWLVTREVEAPADIDTVAEINAWLGKQEYQPRTTYIARLSQTIDGTPEHEGIIEIPAGLGNVAIEGSTEGGIISPWVTRLKGGFEVGEGSTLLLGLMTLVGEGKGKDFRDEEKTIPNYGVWGEGSVQYANCVFLDFYHGIHCEGRISFGGAGAVFQNNHVGLYLNTDDEGGGNPTMEHMVFRGNDIAVEMAKVPTSIPFSTYKIKETQFIDNGTDIKNSTGYRFFVPGNYFKHGDSTTEVVDKNKWFTGNVYPCPVYTKVDEQSGALSELYWGKNAVVKNGDTGNFRIPTAKLAGKYTVIGNPDAANEFSVIFDFGGEQAQAISTFSLRRSRAAEETFDATVDIQKTDTTISLTINTLPSGKTPTITVPCEGWIGASVTFGGGAVESSFANGAVSFVAEQGGTYVITGVQAPALPPVLPPVYSGGTTANPDGTTTSTAISPEGVITETTKAADGTILSVKADVPLGGGTVEIPMKDVTPGTVAVIVAADGTETVVNTSVMTGNGIEVKLEQDAILKIVDKSIAFSDVADGKWYSDAVDYVSARGLFGGVGNNQFDLSGTTTRGMLMTVLARLDGVDTSSGATWDAVGIRWALEQGISDGTNPNGTITREQLAVMLWRLAGSPRSSHGLDSFSDDHQVSDWALEAMRWANEHGVINGSNGRLNPQGVATRGEVAQMLMNFCQRDV